MTTHKELEERMLALSAIEKAEAIQILTKTWSDRPSGITKTPGVCGGDACIGNTRIPVWSLVSYRRLGANDATILEAFPHLSAADLVNAWAYFDAYPAEIEQSIRENDEAMQEDEAI